MRVSAAFEQYEDALVAHRALVDQGEVDPENIEIRSPYPLPEEALPPHRHSPMRMRHAVRLLWVIGAISGFALAAGTQLDYPIKTGPLSIVPIATNAIITYECGMITGLISTCLLFFWETRSFRMQPIPFEEDLAVGNGDCAVVVDGPKADAAREVLQKAAGLRSLRVFESFVLILGLAAMLCTTGCTVRMRTQPAIKDSEAPNIQSAAGIQSMPWWKDPELPGLSEPYGRLLTPDLLAELRMRYPIAVASGGKNTPPEVKKFANPLADNVETLTLGKRLFEENCIFCHGTEGKGDGPVAKTPYQPVPANLSRPDLVKSADGDLYWTLTVAPLGMPAFGNRMSPLDRYAIVKYVRQLQRNTGATPAAASPAGATPAASPAAASPTAASPAAASPTAASPAAAASPATR